MTEASPTGSASTSNTLKTKKRSSPVRRLLLSGLVIYLIMISLLAYFQRSLIYQPYPCGRLLASNSYSNQAVRDVTVAADDGIELHGWLTFASTSPSNAVDIKEKLSADHPVVLMFPGNAGNRSGRMPLMSLFGSIGASTLLVDYRGYADNAGQPSEENFARDARTVWNYLTGPLGVSPHRVVIYGESLGGGVGTRLASELCQEGIQPGGLVLQSTFNSLVATAQFHYPLVPVSLVLIDRFPSESRIGHVTCPILQLHGKRDSIVPFSLGQKLFDAAPKTSDHGIPKHQVVLPNADHNDVYDDPQTMNTVLIPELTSFFFSRS